MAEPFICDYVRTPVGRFGSAFSAGRADHLGAVPLRALRARHPGVDRTAVDKVIYGCANQACQGNRNVACMCALLAGPPDDAPHVNPNGGAIALGHSPGRPGARRHVHGRGSGDRRRARGGLRLQKNA
jgi:acetyl-CoA acetyltransferase